MLRNCVAALLAHPKNEGCCECRRPGRVIESTPFSEVDSLGSAFPGAPAGSCARRNPGRRPREAARGAPAAAPPDHGSGCPQSRRAAGPCASAAEQRTHKRASSEGAASSGAVRWAFQGPKHELKDLSPVIKDSVRGLRVGQQGGRGGFAAEHSPVVVLQVVAVMCAALDEGKRQLQELEASSKPR